ncbi:peptidoglycan-binding domain-containing protein [Allorhizobium undicola]|uniref:peptidoglycan-binding domain-containing protein n=1 Tax=Allorhizobium undicola TaxID=78527 RepID=UPI001376B5E2|nr:peptidoglycan-binding domain-containing protein [Allorhizobium undicola]
MSAQTIMAQGVEPGMAADAAGAAAAAPQPANAWEQEYALWQASANGNTTADYQAYLAAYPAGKFADLAKNRVVRLEAEATPPAPAEVKPVFTAGTPLSEDALLDRGARREVQGRLTSLGFRTGGTDGVFGNNTRLALSNWQSVIGAPVTGYLSYDQLQRLRADSQGRYEDWLSQQTAARRPPRPAGPVLEGPVRRNNDGEVAAALALGVIGGAILGGAIGGGRHHGGPGLHRGPIGCGPRPCR